MLELLMSANTEKSVINLLPAPSKPDNWYGQSGMCVSEDGTSIFIAGGYTRTGAANRTVMCYDIIRRGYQDLPSLPTGFTVTIYLQLWEQNSKLYACMEKNWAVLDLVTLKWTMLTAPVNLNSFSAYGGLTFNHNGRLLVYGAPPSTSTRNSLAEYLPETNTVRLIATNNINTRANYPAATILNDTLYVSHNGTTPVTGYDLAKNTWVKYDASLGTPTQCMAGYDNKLYLMGLGTKFTGVTTYDLLNNVNSEASPFSRSLRSSTMVTVGNLAYAIADGAFLSYKLGD